MTAPPAQRTPLRLRPPRHSVERRAITWWILRSVALHLPILTGLVFAYARWESARAWLVVVLAVLVVSGVVETFVEPWWRYAVHRWEVTDDAVYARTGWLVREWRAAPISRIQTVDAVRGPVEQLLGLSTLRVTTASAKGTIDIGGLDHIVAADIAEELTAITRRTPGDAT
ncbi:PH domain-containing protein [Plantactinospora sp. GCM10030261]|uniref:PH domain-containing protein n=1 Tax=Plantactinospora sp. GCM10030261 TaxID=3273420 RepID=UPI0036228CDD